MKVFVVILSVIAVVASGPVSSEESVLRTVVENFVTCANSDLGLCLKEHALKAAERLGTARHLKIIDGVTLLNNNPREAKSLEPLATDPVLRSRQLTQRLWQSTSDLLQSSELELSYGGNDEEESRAMDNEEEVEEGRGKIKKKQIKKKLKMLIPLMLLAKAKAVAIAVFALVVIAASIFKLALLAKIAFIIKIIAIIKALLAKKHAQEEISWEPQGWDPHAVEHAHIEHGHGWEGGWSRSRNEANNLAYSAYN